MALEAAWGDVELLGRRLAARNRVLEVYLDHVRDAAGNEVEDFMVVAPRARGTDGTTGVAVLPVTTGGQVVLLRIARHAQGALTWEVPRGFVEAGESAADAARRELEEETGLVAPADGLRDLGVVEPEPGILRARTRLFAAVGCRPGRRAGERELGHLGRRALALDDALAEIRAGELREAATVVAILRLHLDGR